MTISPPEDASRPESLDALTAAPEHHTLLFENETVRVLETRIGPKDATPLHTHRWPSAIYLINQSAIVRRDAHGVITFDSRDVCCSEPMRAGWLSSLGPHSIENVGDSDLHVISVEIKDVCTRSPGL